LTGRRPGRKPGTQKTGGRQPGTRNKATLAKEAAQLALIDTDALKPLAYMLAILRDETAPRAERFAAAKEAAPYCHRKLASIEHTGEDGGPIKSQVEIIQWEIVDPKAEG
jgi:hypothetical protein